MAETGTVRAPLLEQVKVSKTWHSNIEVPCAYCSPQGSRPWPLPGSYQIKLKTKPRQGGARQRRERNERHAGAARERCRAKMVSNGHVKSADAPCGKCISAARN
jgi:hypothetical protein